MDGKKEESRGGVRECVFRCGIRQDGLPNPMGNLSLSERERGKEMWAERKGEQGERESEGHRIERIGCEGLGKDR